MENSRTWLLVKILCLVIFIFELCEAQINFGENGSGQRRRENEIVLHTCCDLGIDLNRRECPEVLKPLGEFQRLKEWEIPGKVTLDETNMKVGLTRHPAPCPDMPTIEFRLDSVEPPLIQFQPDGYLMIGNRTLADYVHPEYYCLYGISPTVLKIRICKAKCSKDEPCVRKCCLRTQVLDLHQQFQRCVNLHPPNSQWTPKLFANPANPNSQINLESNTQIRPRIQLRAPPIFQKNCIRSPEGIPVLQDIPYSLHLNLTPAEYETHAFNARLGPDGKLYYRSERRKWEALPDDEYCSDGLTILDDESHVYRDTMNETMYLMCGMPQEEEQQASEYYAALAIACSMFALITVIVYFLLLEKQNIHGWTTMSHSTAVFFLFILLGVAHLTKEHDYLRETVVCQFVGMFAHYFWIAVFCWLFILSFDLWMTFRSLSISSNRSGCHRFLLYSLFGWGFPALFVFGFAWTMDRKFGPDPHTEVVVPMYGHSFCYITRHALWEYLYIPSGILFAVNMTFFLLTAWTLHRYQQSTKMATKNMQKNRQSFMLFLKLFMVAGMLWIIELISFLTSGAHIPWYVQAADTLNVLQPVFIFIIFVLKWEIINALHEKYVWMRPIVYPARILLKRFRRRTNSRPAASQIESTALNTRVNDTDISRVSSDNSVVGNSTL